MQGLHETIKSTYKYSCYFVPADLTANQRVDAVAGTPVSAFATPHVTIRTVFRKGQHSLTLRVVPCLTVDLSWLLTGLLALVVSSKMRDPTVYDLLQTQKGDRQVARLIHALDELAGRLEVRNAAAVGCPEGDTLHNTQHGSPLRRVFRGMMPSHNS